MRAILPYGTIRTALTREHLRQNNETMRRSGTLPQLANYHHQQGTLVGPQLSSATIAAQLLTIAATKYAS